jgi:acetyl-CoA/propionyl-CoA carboxylase biotin carboxyl carrier protein
MARRRRERRHGTGGESGNGAVVSPMQGTVLKVAVTDGDPVGEGDLLLVVEAMKMENEIVAPREGVVRDLAVAAGTGVTSGQLLCVVADPDGE